MEAVLAAARNRRFRGLLRDPGQFERHGPIAFHLTGGEAAESPLFPLLLDIGPDVSPPAAVAEKGYDPRPTEPPHAQGHLPSHTVQGQRQEQTGVLSQTIDRGRARIKQTFGKLKRFKRVARRCEKTAESFDAIVSLALGFILLKSVHTA